MMSTKLISFCACIALASAGLLPNGRDGEGDGVDAHARYSFSYDVQDAETGDFKSQSETRDGDTVQGQYSLHDADGYQRIVEYSVSGDSGFTAVVRREPLNAPIVPAATVAPIRVLPATAAPPSPPPPPPPAPPAPAASPAPIRQPQLQQPQLLQQLQQQQQQQLRLHEHQHGSLLKAFAQPTATAFITPTVLHHAPATHAVLHAAPAVHIAPATHYVHTAAAAAPTTTLLRTSPAVIAHHHHHHAPTAHVVKTAFASPQIKYVF